MKTIDDYGEWYQKINLGGGVFTPGKRDVAEIFELYEAHLPADMQGLRVLDVGSNAAGFSVEFAKRGAQVMAVEHSPEFHKQAQFVVDKLGLHKSISLWHGPALDVRHLDGHFDIVFMLGLFYHLRYPFLVLEVLRDVCKNILCLSTHLTMGGGHSLTYTDVGKFHGFRPTRKLLFDLIFFAGFAIPTVIKDGSPIYVQTEIRKSHKQGKFIREISSHS